MRIALFGVFLAAARASAVFVATGTPNTNTNAPAGDQGWSNVGVYNGASAVYLGGGWFITARHMGVVTTVKLNATNYPIASTSWRSITNSNGTTVDANLFKVVNPLAIPGPGAAIRTSSPGTGSAVTMIGNGWNVSSITTNTYSNKGTQTQVRYYEGTVSQIKWATNTVSGSFSLFESVGFGFFSDVFTTTLATGRGQALGRDSGGGVFINNGPSWDLAGLMIGAIIYSDTNGNFAVTDTGPQQEISKTYCVNLPLYRSQITNITAIVDLDGDTLPDWWEYRYSGSPVSMVATNDSDNDGFSNLQEYIADTNPTNAASFFEMDGISALTNQMIMFSGSTGREYQVFYTTNDLADTNLTWVAAHTNLIWGTGTNSSIIVTNTEPAAFYRLKVTLP